MLRRISKLQQTIYFCLIFYTQMKSKLWRKHEPRNTFWPLRKIQVFPTPKNTKLTKTLVFYCLSIHFSYGPSRAKPNCVWFKMLPNERKRGKINDYNNNNRKRENNVPSLRGVKHSYEISNWKGVRNDAGLSRTVTLVMLTALIVWN